MNRSKSPPVNLEKYLEGKRHRFCTYAQGARLYAMAYWSFVTMAKQEQFIDLRPYREDDSLTQEMMIDILIQKRATPQTHKKITFNERKQSFSSLTACMLSMCWIA